MYRTLWLELPQLLPDVQDPQDACINRLQQLLTGKRGLDEVHVVTEAGHAPTLCLHYDPALIPLAQVERLAKTAGLHVTNQFGHAIFHLRAIDGEDAGQRIEQGLRAVGGVLDVSVNLAAQRARVEFDRNVATPNQIESALQRMGYSTPSAAFETHTEGDGHEHGAEHTWYGRNKELVWSLTAGVMLVTAWLGEHVLGLPRPAAIALYVVSFGFGGYDLTRHALGTLRQGRFSFDIDLLMLLAALGAAALGEWAEGAFLLFLFSLAHALEHYALGRARNAIKALSDLAPPMARVLRDGGERDIPVEQVVVGDTVVVLPGERISADGTIQMGRSAVNQAPITGESVPVEKGYGDEVYAGTINGDGALEIAVTRASGDRTLDRVIKLVEEAQTQKAPTQRFTERFERIFVPTVLIVDVLLIVVPPLLGWMSWSDSFYRGMALLVAASPCALALGTPSAVLAGIAQAARKGVLIKGGEHLENLGTLRALALDKTGTITVGRPEVTEVVPMGGVEPDELLRIAAAVERRSQHPLAEAVVRYAEARGLAFPEAGELQSLTARGVRSSVEGQTVEIGSLRLWQEDGVLVPDEVQAAVERLQAKGRSVVVVRQGRRWLGVFGIADQPRAGVRQVLDDLRALGIRSIVMLTGDNHGVGKAVGKEVGVDDVKAELLPEDKVTTLQELLRTHGQVAMIGDGVNDAPALANATVGIAMGVAGTAVALETADVALMGDDLGKLPFAVGLSRQARAVIKQNLYVSLGVIALLIIATTTGYFGIGPAVVMHEGSTLVVIANALRLLVYKGDR
jgi:Zn2+/Cd2+-exporting ATPase